MSITVGDSLLGVLDRVSTLPDGDRDSSNWKDISESRFWSIDKQISRWREMAASLCYCSAGPLGKLGDKEKAVLSQIEEVIRYLTKQQSSSLGLA